MVSELIRDYELYLWTGEPWALT